MSTKQLPELLVELKLALGKGLLMKRDVYKTPLTSTEVEILLNLLLDPDVAKKAPPSGA